jgi:hypothetical protein
LPVVEAEARIRTKNQITVPDPIARILDVEPNDTLVFSVDPDVPGVAQVRVLPRTFAGALTGVYGTTEDVIRFIREEHADWG